MYLKIIAVTAILVFSGIIYNIPAIEASSYDDEPPPFPLINISTDKTIYRPGEPVRITISIESLWFLKEDYTYIFPSSKQCDFRISYWGLLGPVTIYRWSDGRHFLEILTNITLSPGEKVSWNFTWNQKGSCLFFVWGPLSFIPKLRLPLHQVLPRKYNIVAEIPTIWATLSHNHQFRIAFNPVHI